MAFWSYEGTKDFVVTTPYLMLTFRASGSITAGKGLAYDAGNTSDVYVPTAIAVDTTKCAGIAAKTVATGEACPVIVWGVVKNIGYLAQTLVPGDLIGLSGSGTFGLASSLTGSYIAGRFLSGSGAGGTMIALIDCMK